MARAAPGHRDDLRDVARDEHPALGRVFLVGVARAPAERLEALVERHAAQGLGGVQGAAPVAGGLLGLLGEVAALVPDESGQRVPVLAREVDALVSPGVELLRVRDPLLAGARRPGDAGLREEVLVVDDDAVGGVPGDAVLGAVVAARLSEARQPVVHAEVACRLQGQVVQAALVDVLGDLGVAHLDDVGPVTVPLLERLLDLGADAGPLLDADVQLDVLVLLLEVLGEALDELGRGAAPHQPDGDGSALVPAGQHAAAGEQDGGGEGEGQGRGGAAVVRSHVGHFLPADRGRSARRGG